VSLPIGLAVNLAVHSAGNDKEVLLVLGLCVLVQWVIVQTPYGAWLWPIDCDYGTLAIWQVRRIATGNSASASL
jgi:hypothetical protein